MSSEAVKIPPGRRRAHERDSAARWVAFGAGRFAIVLASWLGVQATSAWGAGNPPLTTCNDLCAASANPCVITSDKVIVPGSVISCGNSRDVQITGGDLLIHDGEFQLKAHSVSLDNTHRIVADCAQGASQGTAKHGFTLQLTGGLTIGNQSKLLASCSVAGGSITVLADGAVTVNGNGIVSDGTGSGAPGGTIVIRSGGAFTSTAKVTATTTSTSAAPGGSIEISAASIAIGDDLDVHGEGDLGSGGIDLTSNGALSVTGGILNAGTNTGAAGGISATAAGTLTSSRPWRARGTGTGGTGGSVRMVAQAVQLSNEVDVQGARIGGSIDITAFRGAVQIGTGGSSAFALDASAMGNSAGQAGTVEVRSRGNSVTIDGTARLYASQTIGTGGAVTVEGVDVTVASGGQITADGASGSGGSINLSTRTSMPLSGSIHANNGEITLSYGSTSPSVGSGVSCPCTQVQDTTITSACGDGWVRLGTEDCDGTDLNGATCASTGHGTGTLRCQSNCTFDFGSCQ